MTTALRTLDMGLPIVRDERQTVENYLDDWLARIKPTVRPRTWQRYVSLVAHVKAEFGSVALTKLSPQRVERLYANKIEAGLSPTTVHHLHTVLHHALDDAMRKGLVARNVTELVDAPRMAEHEIQPLTPDQAQAFLAATQGDRLEALYLLAISTGMRLGELLALKWRDVDLDGQKPSLQVRGTLQRLPEGLMIGLPKTSRSRRRIQLTSLAAEALRHHRVRQHEERLKLGGEWEDHDLVFANTVGKPIEVGNMKRRSFWPLLNRAKLPRIRFHDLRHSAATLLLLQNVHPKVVSEMLGHTSIEITLGLYSHVLPGMQQTATEAMERLLRTGQVGASNESEREQA